VLVEVVFERGVCSAQVHRMLLPRRTQGSAARLCLNMCSDLLL
jgi:hypothetical protein